MKKPKHIVHISERKLGRHQAMGLFVAGKNSSYIAIDPRLTPRQQMDTVLHEAIHYALPDLTEEAVTIAATKVMKIAWGFGYRRMVNPKLQKVK